MSKSTESDVPKKAKATKTTTAKTATVKLSKETAAPKATRAKKTPVSKAPDQATINKMVEEAAYFLAERRSFAPGFDQQDWLEAKAQILSQLKNASPPSKK